MFCPKCGVEAGDTRFCRTCGTNLTVVSNILDTDEHAATTRILNLENKTTVNVFKSSTITNNLDLDGHTAITVFGSTRIDLTAAPLGPGQTHIKIVAVFGDVEVLVPDDVEIRVSGFTLFGAISHLGRELADGIGTVNDKTLNFNNTTKRLHVNATSIFSAVKVGR
jgi:predicted membrane protein